MNKYINIKTGDTYEVLNFNVLDATNATNGRKMVTYKKLGDEQEYTRELEEFKVKFKPVMDKYYFKTRFQAPDTECTEKCNVKSDETMIGSYACTLCTNHIENDMNENTDEMSWIKCSKIQEATTS